jgi:Putative Actinobacterial Holin-X, holin superfamily III
VAAGLVPVWASVAVGAGLLLLAFALLQIGLAQLKPSNLAPKRMMANLRHDAETLKSMVIPDATSNNRR